MDHGALSPTVAMTLRSAAKVAGWIISIACLAFFVWKVREVGLTTAGRGTAENLVFILLGSAAYGGAVGLLSLVWALMLRPAQGATAALMGSYLIGQFAKYLPGNVLHYAARHGLGIKAGAGHAPLVAAAFSEIYLLVCAGTMVALGVGMPTLSALAPELPSVHYGFALLPLAAAFAVSVTTRVAPSWRWLPSLPPATVAFAMAGYLLFFLVFGGLFWLCLAWSSAVTVAFLPAQGTAAVAWLAGFVVPGAPAGVGLRETALGVGMAPVVPASSLAASIVLFRLITLGGDLIAFAMGWLLPNRPDRGTHMTRRPQENPHP